MQKQAKVRQIETHGCLLLDVSLEPFGLSEGFPCIFRIVKSRLSAILGAMIFTAGDRSMDASETLLHAFIFRLSLLVLAVFIARTVPDHRPQVDNFAQVSTGYQSAQLNATAP
jgi:hypothetical protein